MGCGARVVEQAALLVPLIHKAVATATQEHNQEPATELAIGEAGAGAQEKPAACLQQHSAVEIRYKLATLAAVGKTHRIA